MPCSASRRSLTSLHLSGSPTITGTMRLTGHYRQTCRIEDGLCPRCAFLMAVALPLRGLECRIAAVAAAQTARLL